MTTHRWSPTPAIFDELILDILDSANAFVSPGVNSRGELVTRLTYGSGITLVSCSNQ